ncbi:methyltransferase TYW3-domain-containing protein [Pyrenochaeta sp. MPI-SDFR-AT-0127]|nr:methyltransferase TYW3-domain-containing protein [Pyrenochaeta sp. MPI-SDFR-AT-0127]
MASRFDARKQKILEQLDAPDGEYHDSSPKGSIDEPIRDMIGEINRLDGLVTTSSCSGRISVFLEGRKAEVESVVSVAEGEESRAGPGGKGGGGAWLFISHSPVATNPALPSNYMTMFGLQKLSDGENVTPNVSSRYIHLKFEPMILHILSSSLDHAQRILTAALAAGFRESGAVSLSSTKSGEINPMVAVRSTGFSFDSIIGYHNEDGRNIPLVDESYLRILMCIANERFKINVERITRFRAALIASYQPQSSIATGALVPDWEDGEARKRRKREEGLARQQALQAKDAQNSHARAELSSNDTIEDIFH